MDSETKGTDVAVGEVQIVAQATPTTPGRRQADAPTNHAVSRGVSLPAPWEVGVAWLDATICTSLCSSEPLQVLKLRIYTISKANKNVVAYKGVFCGYAGCSTPQRNAVERV